MPAAPVRRRADASLTPVESVKSVDLFGVLVSVVFFVLFMGGIVPGSARFVAGPEWPMWGWTYLHSRLPTVHHLAG